MQRLRIIVLGFLVSSACPGLAPCERTAGYQLLTRQTLDRDGPSLAPTGRSIRLTVGGLDALPRPTGLAFPPDDGRATFLRVR